MVCKETEAQYALAPLLGAVRESSHHPHQEHPLKPPKAAPAATPDPLEPAFLAFLNDTVLNSFDGGEHSPLISPGGVAAAAGGAAASHHMARAHSGGGSDLLIDMDRAAAAAAAAAAGRRWDAAPAGAAFDQQQHHAPAQRVLAVAKRGYESPEDDTASADTMPMPNKRRRGGVVTAAGAGGAAGAQLGGAPLGGATAASDDAEVTSPGGPNDLVELPSDGNPAAGAAAAGSPNNNAAAAAAAAEAEAIFKAVLVAKVLTKSDASSKRVILPRIAIEANLPHLTAPGGGGGAHGQGRCMHFAAMDGFGYTHQLVIKAWANGANPKPVYVLEGVGELIKAHRLGPGDVIGVLASKGGRYFVHWNTPQMRDAAARPTLSTFEFAQHEAREAEAAAAASAAAAAAEQAEQQQQQAAAANAAPSQPAPGAAAPPALLEAAGSHTGVLPAALALAAAAAAAAAAAPAAMAPAQDPTAVILPPPAPLMTAIPVASAPLLAGHYLPTSPCEMLVMGAAPAAPAASGPSYLRLDHGGDGVHEWTEPAPAAGGGGSSGGGAFGGEGAGAAGTGAAAGALFSGLPMLLGLAPAVPPAPAAPAAERVGGIVHQAGALLCPRTAGCTRPAGHQGWCQGHKGHNKSQRRR